MSTKVNPLLIPPGVAQVNANRPQVAYKRCFFHVPATEQAQDAARKLGDHSPAKRQPLVTVTRMTQQRCPKVPA